MAERSISGTTTAATATSAITLSGAGSALEVFNRELGSTSGDDVLWVQYSGTAPTVGGDECFPVPPGVARVVPARNAGYNTVRLIATNAVDYTVSLLP